METLTYPYGETPEATIREREDALGCLRLAIFGRDDYAHLDTDDVVVLLASLLRTSRPAGPSTNDGDVADAACSLRVKILDALGIVEA